MCRRKPIVLVALLEIYEILFILQHPFTRAARVKETCEERSNAFSKDKKYDSTRGK